jgi:hypothetical protein
MKSGGSWRFGLVQRVGVRINMDVLFSAGRPEYFAEGVVGILTGEVGSLGGACNPWSDQLDGFARNSCPARRVSTRLKSTVSQTTPVLRPSFI